MMETFLILVLVLIVWGTWANVLETRQLRREMMKLTTEWATFDHRPSVRGDMLAAFRDIRNEGGIGPGMVQIHPSSLEGVRNDLNGVKNLLTLLLHRLPEPEAEPGKDS